MSKALSARWRTAFVLCGLWVSNPLVASEVYRWVDAQGKTHFGDRPADRKAEQLQMPSQPSRVNDGADRAARTQRLLDQFASERTRRETDRAKAEQHARAKAEACHEARSRAIEAEEAGYLYDRDEQGHKRILSDAETRAARSRARNEAARLCD